MALQVYDPDKHHVGLGDSAETLKGFVLAGGARAMLQNAPQVTEFGSSRNLVDAPALSRWTQDDFLGGGFWPTWHSADPTVWSASKDYIPSQQGRSLRSVPPFYLWDDETGGTTPGNFVGALNVGDYHVAVWQNRFVRTKLSDKTRTEYAVPTSPNVGTFCAVGIDSVGPSGWPVLMLSRIHPTSYLYPWFSRYRLDTWAAEAEWSFGGSMTGRYHAYAFEMDGIVPLMVVAGNDTSSATYRNQLYSFTSSSDAALVGRLPGTWVDSVVYNGLVYIICVDSYTGLTRIVTCDGGTISILMDMPYNFVGTAIINYAGSIWITGYGSDVNNAALYGELHQITGNTSRLVKTFSPENQVGSYAYTDLLRTGRTLAVWEGLLWIGGDHDRLLAYDVTTDALYGACEYSNGTSGVTQVLQLASGKGDLFGYCKHTTDATRTGWYRVARTGDGVTSYTPELITSDFNPEPALDKRWAAVHILSRYDDADPVVAFSTDGGDTWTPATSTVVAQGTFRRTVADLSGAPVSRQIRLRLRFPRADNVANYQELIAFTVTFSFLDSGSRSWVLPVLGVDRPELEDLTYPQFDLAVVEAQLWSWIEEQTPLTFADLDGQTHNVQLINLQKMYTEVGPPVDNGVREGFYHLTLVEIGGHS